MKKQGFLQAAGVALYCSLIGFVMFNIADNNGGQVSFLFPVSVLLLFSVSALICGLMVFYKPYLLFFENKKKEAIDLVLHTTMWLFVFFVSALLLAIITR